ncbi:MAG: transcriptional regulator MarR family [Rhodospirillales bacterium]|jgi:DNA-binding MarR family transcriptional regulator|nr:transcriptional regulator MarR family [Rhodospirillales bacterium]
MPDDRSAGPIDWREAIPNDRLAHLIKTATRCVTRSLQLRLAEHDVSIGHWIFLRILWENDGLTQRALSEQAGLMESTTFSALKAMTSLGYVTRRARGGAEDGGKKGLIFLTPEGRALKEKLVPLAEEVNDIAIAGADPADVAAARRVMLTMIGNLVADEAEGTQGRRIPSTREIARIIADSGKTPRRTATRKTNRETS